MIGVLPAAALLALVLIASCALTAGLRRYALARRVLDMPNARSSHAVPTPRGGGVAIVLSFMLALSVLAAPGGLDWPGYLALAGAGVAVAIVGFVDDHRHIAARWRLLAHFAAATWALGWLGGAPPLSVLGLEVAPGWLGFALAALFLVWLLNLYNFMDGIDGIASVEAITVCIGGALLYWISGHAQLSWLPLLLAAAVAGFLIWNFPPARIFMGDAGSGFLGVVLGVMALQAGWVSAALFWAWAILLGVFVVDATVTLLRRLLRGERVYEAHRSHAYQYAARRYGRHLPVTVAVGCINLAWLLPLAIWVGSGGLDGAVGVLVAYAPLVVLALRLDAGKPESR